MRKQNIKKFRICNFDEVTSSPNTQSKRNMRLELDVLVGRFGFHFLATLCKAIHGSIVSQCNEYFSECCHQVYWISCTYQLAQLSQPITWGLSIRYYTPWVWYIFHTFNKKACKDICMCMIIKFPSSPFLSLFSFFKIVFINNYMLNLIYFYNHLLSFSLPILSKYNFDLKNKMEK